MFLIALIGQVVGASLLPKTHGFLDMKWTVASLSCFDISLGMIAILVRNGFALSILVPLLSGMAPLAISIIASVFWGESGSASKITLLVVACGIICLAGFVS